MKEPAAGKRAFVLGSKSKAPALLQARTGHHAESARLLRTRKTALTAQETRLEGQIIEVLRRGLEPTSRQRTSKPGGRKISIQSEAPLSPQVVASVPEQAAPSPGKVAPLLAAAQAATALAIVERIEAWVRHGLPTLTLTLADTNLKGLRIDRVGPREIALRLDAKAGAETSQLLAALPAALRSRGLRLARLSLLEEAPASLS